MDYSTKVKSTTSTAGPTEQSETRTNNRYSGETDAASSPLTLDQQETGSYPCPACPIVVTTSRDLTNHLRGHNSPRSTDYSGEEDYSCGVCHKVLSSASSLDRHVLVHSGERPFKCKYCDMAFTTNGNMNRHLRTAHGSSPRGENNGYTDSEGSSDSERSGTRRRHRIVVEQEYNNNEVGKRRSPELMNSQQQLDSSSRYPGKRRRSEIVEDLDNPTRKHRILLGNSLSGEIHNGEVRSNESSGMNVVVHSCPVCGRVDFPTSALLEAHLEKHHPEFPAKCDPCNLSFKNHRVLNLHKYMKHIEGENSPIGNNGRNLRNSVVGFHDLTFVDFSSDKFPAIARAVCEQSLHRPASGEATKFQCDKCLRAFPCRSALDAHEIDCGTGNHLHRSSNEFPLSDEHSSTRDDFFAGLDLQNRAAINEAKEGKDLADIQSIISVTSGPILQNFPRSDASTPEHHRGEARQHGSSGSSGTPSSSDYHQEEEAQDAFAAEFRRMKLKGEFPCRLCDAVFPNLRALKGHNRSHMGVGPGMPYPCNMCSYTSNDKGTLVRHLRSHNGDRPFECSLCNFAFTTKANCERHVRNRHGKVSREEIKSVIIYHPSEDSTNDAGSLDRTPESRREEARKTLLFPENDGCHQQRRRDFYLGMPFGNKVTGEDGPMSLHASSLAYEKSSDYSKERAGILDVSRRRRGEEDDEDEDPEEQDDEEEEDYDDYDYDYEGNNEHKSESNNKLGARSSERDDDRTVSLVSDTKTSSVQHQRAQASPIDLKRSSSSAGTMRLGTSVNGSEPGTGEDGSGEDAPLDLSMDVLDLSKKSGNARGNSPSEPSPGMPGPEEFSRNQKDFYEATNHFLLTQALLKAGQTNPAASLDALYANAHMLYRNFGGFSAAGVGASMLPPYLFNPHMFAGQDFGMKERLRKELVRGLQLTSGGNIVEPPLGTPGYPGSYPAPPGREALAIPRSASEQQDYGKPGSSKNVPMATPSKIVTSTSMRDPKLENCQSSNSSVKMVIKNGVLMPKQKQRRYRTERPFTCEHCSARFTLRSNMERHVKQQHPHHWSQRPRGGHSTRGRPPANPPSLVAASSNHHSSSAQQTSLLPKTPANGSSNEKHAISDQVKYAILAQQLKGNAASTGKLEDCDTEEELVIDEAANETRENPESESHAAPQQSTSLLRGKLEGSNNPYTRERAKEEKRAAAAAAEEEKRKRESREDGPISKLRVKTEPKEERAEEEAEEEGQQEEDEGEEEEDNNEENEEDEDEEDDENAEEEKSRIPAKAGCSRDSAKPGCSSSPDGTHEDLASVSELLDNASQQYQQFQPQYVSDEEGLVASTSDCNNSGSEDKSDSVNSTNSVNSQSSSTLKKRKKKKKSAYSMAPNRVICPYCQRPFPWTSSLRRHILTHTGQKPYRCLYCSLLFTTKSNCDRHLLRKHKNCMNKNRRRNSSSPEAPEQPSNNNNNNNANSTNNNINSATGGSGAANSAFAMRNVPERPYKCNLCPSSTFATLGNLKKHKSSKHPKSAEAGKSMRAESPVTSEPRNSPITTKQDNSEYESQSSGASENNDHQMENLDETGKEIEDGHEEASRIEPDNSVRGNSSNLDGNADGATDLRENSTRSQENSVLANDSSKTRRVSPRSSPGPSDTPFKCHLCDSGFSERQDCLDHIRINHTRSYEILVAKGALDMDIETPEDHQHSSKHTHASDGEEKRGKFPDYSNRKVICAFCMRRFWSAEDLRRHMRTHTGERPFSCDICFRRFTLKHSMLRHRKKHESPESVVNVGGGSGDEESGPSQPPTITPRSQQGQSSMLARSSMSCESRLQERISLPTVATVATGDAAPSGLMRFNRYDKLATLTGKMSAAQPSFECSPTSADTENDLISNLLGIPDKSIIDKVLQASADDAAKLLGVKRHND